MGDRDQVRVLLAQLTPEEKLSLLHQRMPPIPSLGLAAFHTGAEAAHGVAWEGLATVFPQPVGLAATWDPGLIERVGTVVGTELRAKHAADPEIGLNAWAPVVNPLRHPLWGRNEEGFAEDPWLTGVLATAYAEGMRGPLEPDGVWRVVPTLKHLCGYNNETDRDVSDSQLRPRVLHEYELEAFAVPIRARAVGAVMAAYNLINGRPAHVSADLLDQVRSWTDESLLVVSDAYAPSNLAGSQHYCADDAAAHAAALRAGVDSFTNNDSDAAPTIRHIRQALERGLLDWADVDRAVERLLRLRARTGELDGHDPYAAGPKAITADDLDLPAHRELAREAAAASVVVLRNEGLLPLEPHGRVAILGPFAERVLQDWYSGTPPYAVSVANAVRAAWESEAGVEVADGADRIALRPLGATGYLRVNEGHLIADGEGDESACEFVRTEWGDGVCTLAAADGRLWTVSDGRWVRATADRVDGWEVQESFRLHRHDDGTWSIQHLGTRRWLRVDVADGLSAETDGPMTATRFRIEVRADGLLAARTAAAGAETVLVTVGNEPHLLGRETRDRSTLRLPPAQTELIRVARAAHRRVVLIIVSSYPYALDDVAATSPAVVWTSHAGQELGHGLMDVLTGAVEPGGRLTQTWPAADEQLPGLFDYDIIEARSTYWYSPHRPLYPFGHGLGYADASYAALHVEPGRASVEVVNEGSRPLIEVVQAYVSAPEHRLRFPRRLAGWARVRLEPGERRRVQVTLRGGAFETYDVTSGRMLVERGRYVVEVGRSAGDVRGRADLELDGEVVGPRSLAEPVSATTFDRCEGARLAPREQLRGSVVEARDGLVRFDAVDLTGVAELALWVQAMRSAGEVAVELDGRRVGSAPAGAEWSMVTVPVPAAGVVELGLVLRDARLDTVGTAAG